MRQTLRVAVVLVALSAICRAAGAGGQDLGDAVSFDATIPGGLQSVARSLGVESLPPPPRLLPDLVRRLHEAPAIATGEVVERLARLESDPPAPSAGVAPFPLSPSAWSALLQRDVTEQNAFAAVLNDRRASLLAYGLVALDSPTRRWLTEHPALLDTLYAQAAPVFAAFGRSLRVRDGRVVTPGGIESARLWGALVGVPPEQPALFAERLFNFGDDGRLAYLYDTIANLDDARARFALGLWIAEDGGRLQRFLALYDTVADLFRREWRLGERPFSRLEADLTRVLMTIRVDDTGEPIKPAWQPFWRQVFAGDDLDGRSRSPRDLERSLPLDASALVRLVTVGDPGARENRLETIAFAQRVFSSTDGNEAADVLVALRARRAYPALMATLERTGVTAPSVYAATAQRGERLSRLGRDVAIVALRQFQSALGILERVRSRRVLDAATTVDLVRSLVAIEDDGRHGYGGRLVAWFDEQFLVALGWRPDDGEPVEPRLLAAMAGLGAAAEAGMPRFVQWEGHDYRVDIVAAETERLRRVRERQGGLSLDDALAVAHAAARLRERPASYEALRSDVELLARAVYGRPRALDPAGVSRWPPDVPLAMGAVAQLTQMKPPGDLDRVPDLAPPLVDFGDVLVAEVLTSIVYATALGDPDGRVLLGPNVAYRHDFGFDLPNSRESRRARWSLPTSNLQPGEAWHLTGSVLGLDVALSSYGLRRVLLDAELRAPALNSNERRTFVDTVALVNPFELTDDARTEIVAAIARGRERVLAVVGDPVAVDALVAEARVDAERRQALAWLARHGTGRIDQELSLAELAWLGRPALSVDLDAWGMSALALDGCLCTRFPTPGTWRAYTGRPGTGLLGTQVVDLTLRVAELLDELELPAVLTPYVLSAATLEFVDRVQLVHEDDWQALVATARALTRERVEDYMATLAVGGPLIPDGDRPPEEGHR